MPIIEMHLLEGRSTEMKAKTAELITAAAAEGLGVSPSTVRILITEHKKDGFYVAGKAGRASDQNTALEESVE
ncbi:MAG: 4-oxalocrotonate tautomerase [Oceanospirillaceae bacterium]|nr:4-oxalocrotonate tautomerase [Oceanospirillaceae bacterium]|tara:strand:- start:1105 stop:1323 length:219 start_codon:yes stop_codon:yes gene_type:complete